MFSLLTTTQIKQFSLLRAIFLNKHFQLLEDIIDAKQASLGRQPYI